MTVRKILEALQEQGPLSRAGLMRETGISAPTVSKAVTDLLGTGLLEEGQAPDNALGRPGKKLQLARDSAHVVGIVLDPDRCRVVLASLDGKIDDDDRITFATPADYSSLLNQLVDAVQAIAADVGSLTLGIGISTPGLVDAESGKSLFSPNLQTINHQHPAADIEQRTGFTTVCLQEMHALSLGERLYGRARGLDNFAMLDITKGLGLGVFSNGELLLGNNGLAGELGHITIDPSGRLCGCGNHGCLETLATDSALEAIVSERLGRTLQIDDIIDGMRSGSLKATQELNQVCEYLSIAMAATINMFNPSTLFVHGRLLSIGDSTLEHVVRMTQLRSLAPSFERCQMKRAATSKDAGAIATIVDHLTRAAGPRVAH